MGATRRVILELPEEDAALLDQLVTSGTYPSQARAVSEALRLYQNGDFVLETWLRDRVGPIVDAARANPTAALSGEQVLDHLKALHSR